MTADGGSTKGSCAVSPRRYMLSRDRSGFEGCCCCSGMNGSMGGLGPILAGIEG